MPDYTGSQGNDTINAAELKLSPGTNIFAGDGDDKVIADNNLVDLGPGNDELIGTANTTLVFWSSPKGAVVNLATGVAQDGAGGVDKFNTNLITVMGNAHDDTVTGNQFGNIFWSIGGHDFFDGAEGVDTLIIQPKDKDSLPVFSKKNGNWVVTYTDSNGPNQSEEPAVVAISTPSGKFVDASAMLEGQTLTKASPLVDFMHDLAVGDLNGDHIDDIFASNELWISTGTGTWRDMTSLVQPYENTANPMSSAIGDIDGDGRNDILVLYPNFASQRSVLLSDGKTFPTFKRIDLPPGLFGSNSKDNFSIIADLNRDGLADIVVAETRAEPYYRGSAIQILIQTSAGVFEDQTLSRIDNAPRSNINGAEGNLFFVDANGDGHPDLIHTNSAETDGIAIFINDGSGHFSLMDRGLIPFIQPWQLDGYQTTATGQQNQIGGRGYPIQINDDGIIDFVLAATKPVDFPQTTPSEAALYTLVSSPNAFGRDKDENLVGSKLDDKIYGLGGNDSINGGAGFDTAFYLGKLSNYKIIKQGEQYLVSDQTGRDGVDHVINIEQLAFSDKTINLQIQQTSTQIASKDLARLIELYIAFFNRVPDANGLAYWIGEKKSGQTIDKIAEVFYNAGVSFSNLTGYQANMSNSDFINLVYKNVLGRKDGADSDGLNYWNAELSSGKATRGALVSTILDAAHGFKGDVTWGAVADLLDNKIHVAKTIAIDWGLGYKSSTTAIEEGMRICSAISATDTQTSLSIIGVSPDNLSL